MALLNIVTLSSGVIKEGISIETNELMSKFGSVSKAVVPASSVIKLMLQGEGADQYCAIRYTDGSIDEINYIMVDYFDGVAVTTNEQLFELFKNVFISE